MKKKNAVKKADRSGTSTAAVNKAKSDIEPYLFFSWFDEFTRPRISKSNVQEIVSEGESINEEEDMINALTRSDVDTEDEMYKEDNTLSKPPPVKKMKRKKRMVKEQEDDMDEIMKGVAMDIRERRSVAKTEDAEDLFGKSIAMELRRFSERERYIIKHEFNEILFRYTMKKFQTSTQHTQQSFHNFMSQSSFSSPSNPTNPLFNLQSPTHGPISPVPHSPAHQNMGISTQDRNTSYANLLNN